jgi:hypothetical protein
MHYRCVLLSPIIDCVNVLCANNMTKSCIMHVDEGKKANWTALELMDQFCDAAASLFQFIITRRGAICLDVYKDLSKAVVKRSTFSGFAAKLAEDRADERLDALTLYTQLCEQRANILMHENARMEGPGSLRHAWSVGNGISVKEPESFDDVQVCVMFTIFATQTAMPCRHSSYVDIHALPMCRTPQ